MWAFVFFDLPVKTKCERKMYARFRHLLLEEGFMQIQYSVYARFFGTEKQSEPTARRIRANLPHAGNVRILRVTDRQFSRMENFFGLKKQEMEAPDEQILLF